MTIKWSTESITHLAPHLTYPDIDRSLFLVLLHIARVFKDHIFIGLVWPCTQKDFTPVWVHEYKQFLWSVVLCRNPRSSNKRQHSGFAGGEWWCWRKRGGSAYGVLFWRGNKIGGSGNISWGFTQSCLESFLQLCLKCSELLSFGSVSLPPSPARLSFILAKKSFLHRRRSVGDPSSEVFWGSVNPGRKAVWNKL